MYMPVYLKKQKPKTEAPSCSYLSVGLESSARGLHARTVPSRDVSEVPWITMVSYPQDVLISGDTTKY